ncbi:hypothetical protein ACUNWD_05225 [Sunxiuqinia sp. A32]|uniref:hypothetical protein n=1 Tax=Sunxiuqinia sp. A32 TaxID=3461496 RepID=UPI004045E845
MKKILSLLLPAILLLFASCQQEELIIENEEVTTLKSASIIDGQYSASYSGGEWEIVLPDMLVWNAQPFRYLIFYAHGMVDPVPGIPPALPNDYVGERPVQEILSQMGMGYAATSYRANGLVVLDAVDDVCDLVTEVNNFFTNNPEYFPPDFMFLGGPSEGGLVTIKTIESHPNLFDGAISICGPIGSFQNQLKYNGNFHVLFNYFFEKKIDVGTPLYVDAAIMEKWVYGILQAELIDLLSHNLVKLEQLLKCAKVTVDYDDPAAMVKAAIECLRFNVMLTNDVISRMGGVPFDNTNTWYTGSHNDRKLNSTVQRISASASAAAYETTGNIGIPVVTIHTTGDHITPFWHNPLYRLKVFLNGKSLLHSGIPVVEYGHCTITESHLAAALTILITKTSLINQIAINNEVFTNEDNLQTFEQIMKDNSIDIEIK